MYSADDVFAAIYAREVDQLAEQWHMTTLETIAFLNQQEIIICQPTTISPARRAAGIQMSLFDSIEEPEADVLPNFARYTAGKRILAEAFLIHDQRRKALSGAATIKHGSLFFCLHPKQH